MEAKLIKGKVYLVGAGVGSIDFLTIKAAKVIAEADVVVYDRLVDSSVIELAKPGVELIYMGKEPGDDPAIQKEIIKTLTTKANEGESVVRLKSGDPFIFGRGGEELLALKDAGIEFELVPGLTSAIAIPTFAGIPLTIREVSSSILILTGHHASPEDASYFAKHAKFDGTIVLLMAKKNLLSIMQTFMGSGMNPEKAVAALTLKGKDLSVTLGTVSTIADKVSEKADSVVVVIGDVVAKALSTNKVLLTSLDTSIASKFFTSGFTPIVTPVIKLIANQEEITAFLAALKSKLFDSLVFMSPRAVDMINFDRENLDYLSRVKVYAIGPSTKKSLEAKGISVETIPSDFSSTGLLEILIDKKGELGRVALVRSTFADSSLSEKLHSANMKVTEFKLYRTERDEQGLESFYKQLASGVDTVVFTSRSSVHYIIEYFKLKDALDDLISKLKKVRTVCIGSETAKELDVYNLNPEVSDVHTLDGVLMKLKEGKQN